MTAHQDCDLAAERHAVDLMTLSWRLGETIDRLNELARKHPGPILAEREAYETIVTAGLDLMRALRVMAMRLDRAALAKALVAEESR